MNKPEVVVECQLHERISGVGEQRSEVVIVNEVANERIRRVWVFSAA